VEVTVLAVTAVWSRLAGRVSVVDVAWGLGFVAVALTSAVLGDGNEIRRWMLAGLVTIWGGRLAWHIHRRTRLSPNGPQEDPRYAAMLGDPSTGSGRAALNVVRKVFAPQGLALWFVSLPLVVAATSDVPGWGWPVVWVGVVVWLTGLVFESVGDAQLAAYRRDPDRGPVMDRGLWAWTRHPNYFGDACVWWGIWLVGGLASGLWWGLLTMAAPAAMTYFLVFATGGRLLERTMMKRPGYREYAVRTSMFLPLPPRR